MDSIVLAVGHVVRDVDRAREEAEGRDSEEGTRDAGGIGRPVGEHGCDEEDGVLGPLRRTKRDEDGPRARASGQITGALAAHHPSRLHPRDVPRRRPPHRAPPRGGGPPAASGAQGFNIGMNMGGAAGAGIAAHLHQHVVPRWGGDTNFMPVTGRTRVLPQLLADTRKLLADSWPVG